MSRRLPELLDEHRSDLHRYLQRRAGRLLRYESSEDLVQGVHLRAIERGKGFEYRNREAFLKWLHTVANSYLVDRVAYWTALRRRPGLLLRLTAQASTPFPGAVAEPPTKNTGPITFAQRREQVDAAIRALDLLMPRDRRIVLLKREGMSIEEIGKRVDLNYNAAERAHARAVERYRKAFRLCGGEL